MFLIYLFSFLLSWFCGMFVILVTAFFTYEEFSIIDITSFAILTFIAFFILVILIYTPLLIILRKQSHRFHLLQFIPAALIFLANLPVYFLVWRYTGNLYGRNEAFLFTINFASAALIYGLCMEWKNKVVLRL